MPLKSDIALVPDIPRVMPTSVEKKVPAHIGQAMKRPVMAPPPAPPKYDLVLRLWPFLNPYKANVIFKLTSVDRTTASAKLIGMIKIIKLSDRYAVNVGTKPGKLQQGVIIHDGIITS